MDENRPEGLNMGGQSGKRLMPSSGPSMVMKRVIITICAVVLALGMAYLAGCAYVEVSGAILPRTAVSGIAVGGLTHEKAQETLSRALSLRPEGYRVSLAVAGMKGTTAVHADNNYIVADATNTAQAAWSWGRTHGFFAQGGYLIASLVAGHTLEAEHMFTALGEAEVEAVLDEVSASLGDRVIETTHELMAESLVIHKGVPGRALDRAAVKQGILDRAATAAETPLDVTPIVTPPAALEMERLRLELLAKAADARLDVTSKEIVPAVVGVDFDVDAAEAALESTPEGDYCTVELIFTQPEMTTEELTASLFRDVLGTATSSVGGSGNRRANVKLSASVCNDYIMLPGDIFAYNETTGSRSADKGYLPAPAYVGGLSVDEVGGGICQTSSTIYYATLNANLKIVERRNHMFAVGYVKDGMDATVYYGLTDFRFENNTVYPIKIVTESYDKGGSRWLTVKILGTKTTDNYVVMTKKEVSSIPPVTVYRADPSVPLGTTRNDPKSTAYRGRKVEAYRNIYDKDDKLISSTLESVNNYKKRDKIVLVNPAEIGNYGPGGPITTPTPSVAPTTPGVTQPPVEDPSLTPPTEPAVSPAVTAPAESLPPASVDAGPAPIVPPDNGIPTFTPPVITQ